MAEKLGLSGSAKSATKKAMQDDSIMATNNSSIVSKRSVERLYYIEPFVFRPFVKKPQRRSPLINRGYWLRMHAVQYVVKQFLQEATTKGKVIVNLGCGYDPLAFQVIPRCRGYLEKTLFIDVDYPQLIRKKVEVVRNDRELNHVVGINCTLPPSGPVVLRSKNYLAVGCDLRDLKTLNETLEKEVDVPQCSFLLIAEVSITYMEIKEADAVIQWASKLGDARFCLLEQCLPHGASHPFAQTMLNHFKNLRTSLSVVHQYPTTDFQQNRFLGLGWHCTRGRTLWDLWGDNRFLNAWQRASLNTIEPFDEWEEFALFANHYFLLVAIKSPSPTQSPIGLEWFLKAGHRISGKLSGDTTLQDSSRSDRTLGLFHNDNISVTRRFGALLQRIDKALELHGGLGSQARATASQLFTRNRDAGLKSVENSNQNPMKSRVCHTITRLRHSPPLNIMIGGRASPSEAFSDCWRQTDDGAWREESALPKPLYRHSAVSVSVSSASKLVDAVLVYGGRSTDGKISNEWFLCQFSRAADENSEPANWSHLSSEGSILKPRFGCSLITTGGSEGFLLGGMGEDGTIFQELYQWSLESVGNTFVVHLKDQSQKLNDIGHMACRVGATIVSIDGLRWTMVGGITSDGIVPDTLQILEMEFKNTQTDVEFNWRPIIFSTSSISPRPLFIGHQAVATPEGVFIVGGGANCFSFGTCWSSGLWILSHDQGEVDRWYEVKEKQSAEARAAADQASPLLELSMAPNSVQTARVASQSDFQDIVRAAVPVIIEGLGLGSCSNRWTLTYLREAMSLGRQVIVHESESRHMSFQTKNFKYLTKPFATFIDEISTTSGPKTHQYLRSLASTKPAEQPANFFDDYPELASDVELPPELGLVLKRMHSSVLRVAGDVGMWLHYDVMANILIPFSTPKIILLYPPSQITQLSFPPGSTTSTISPFDTPSTLPTPISVTIPSNSILYIPPLWSHAAEPPSPSSSGEAPHSIALNIFFRSFPDEAYSAGRDVYGNRDLRAYEQGRTMLERVSKGLDGIECGDEVKGFYAERLAMELLDKARIWKEKGMR